MMRWGALVAGAVIAMLSAEVAAQTQSPPPPVREITKIAGEVYRFRNNFHYSVFAVTPAGVIATDPINADAAKWLRQRCWAVSDSAVGWAGGPPSPGSVKPYNPRLLLFACIHVNWRLFNGDSVSCGRVGRPARCIRRRCFESKHEA